MTLRSWRRLLLVAVLGSAVVACSPAEPEVAEIVEQGDWGRYFDEANVVGAFAVREVGSDRTLVWDPDRVEQRRSPASTFKILNSMIILQTGVGDPMAEWVDAAGYGNADIGGGIDQFWLDGDLEISPLEQLEFLERMVTGDLPFDPAVVAAVREIIVRERGAGWAWSHKTGTALAEQPTLGWLVGTTGHDGRSWVFAMNVDLSSTAPGVQVEERVRQAVSRRILEEVGALPSP